MATRYKIAGHGQIEINNCAFRRDGRIEAQCKPAAGLEIENGMLLAIDAGKREVALPTAEALIGIVYSAEKTYGTDTGLKAFANEDALPRLGYLAVGDKFTTNCLSHSYSSDEALVTAIKAYKSAAVYGGIDTATGAILCAGEKPVSGPVLKVIEATTMPDGTFGVKFQVIEA